MFLFMTRTEDEDYTLREEKGMNADYSSEKIFSETLRRSGIGGTEKPFALLMHCGRKIFIMAGGMKIGSKDKEGRPVRFTFLFDIGENDAAKIFANLTDNWENSERLLRSCIDVEEYIRNRILFHSDIFIERLSNYKARNIEVPPKGNMLKWEKSSGIITELSIKPTKSWYKSVLAAAVIVALISGVIIFLNAEDGEKPFPLPVFSEAQAISSELNILSWDIHTRYMAAEKEYEDAEDEVRMYLAGGITSRDLARLNEIVPLRDKAGIERDKISGDIAELERIYSDFSALSNDRKKIIEISRRISRLKSRK